MHTRPRRRWVKTCCVALRANGPQLSTAHIHSLTFEIVSGNLRNIIYLGELRGYCRIKVCSRGSWRVKKSDSLTQEAGLEAVTDSH